MIGHIAKAITAFIVSGLIYLLGDVNVVHDISDDLEALIEAGLTALAVWAIPNWSWATGARRRPVQ